MNKLNSNEQPWKQAFLPYPIYVKKSIQSIGRIYCFVTFDWSIIYHKGLLVEIYKC